MDFINAFFDVIMSIANMLAGFMSTLEWGDFLNSLIEKIIAK